MTKILSIFFSLLWLVPAALELASTPINELRNSDFFAVSLGVAIAHLIFLSVQKTKAENSNKEFSIVEFSKAERDDWAFAVVYIVVMGLWGDDAYLGFTNIYSKWFSPWQYQEPHTSWYVLFGIIGPFAFKLIIKHGSNFADLLSSIIEKKLKKWKKL